MRPLQRATAEHANDRSGQASCASSAANEFGRGDHVNLITFEQQRIADALRAVAHGNGRAMHGFHPSSSGITARERAAEISGVNVAVDEVIVRDVGEEVAIRAGAWLMPVGRMNAPLRHRPALGATAAEPLPSALREDGQEDEEHEDTGLLELRIHESTCGTSSSVRRVVTACSDISHRKGEIISHMARNCRLEASATSDGQIGPERGRCILRNMRALAVIFALALLASTVVAQKAPAKRPAARAKGPSAAEQRRQASEAEDRQAIEQLHQDDIAANLAFDVDKLMADVDDDVVVMPPGSKPIVGRAAYHDYLATRAKDLANVEILAYEATWDEVRILGDYAYEYGSIRSRMRQVNAKDETPQEYSTMRVLKKEPTGIWKIYRTIWNDRKNGGAPEKYK